MVVSIYTMLNQTCQTLKPNCHRDFCSIVFHTKNVLIEWSLVYRLLIYGGEINKAATWYQIQSLFEILFHLFQSYLEYRRFSAIVIPAYFNILWRNMKFLLIYFRFKYDILLKMQQQTFKSTKQRYLMSKSCVYLLSVHCFVLSKIYYPMHENGNFQQKTTLPFMDSFKTLSGGFFSCNNALESFLVWTGDITPTEDSFRFFNWNPCLISFSKLSIMHSSSWITGFGFPFILFFPLLSASFFFLSRSACFASCLRRNSFS